MEWGGGRVRRLVNPEFYKDGKFQDRDEETSQFSGL